MNNLSLEQFYNKAEDIDRACTTVIENSISIFLPFKRLDKTEVYEVFKKNNKTLELENQLFDKVEIKGRLLGQTHKDILEALLTTSKIFNEESRTFKIRTTAYKILKKLKKSTSNKKWLIEKIDEIAEARVKIYFKSGDNKNITFNFGFISSILTEDEQKLIINFTPEYTHFMAKNELLDYSNYVVDIVSINKFTRKLSRDLDLVHNINSDFLKAIVRYMLIHKGNNSQISIDKLIEKLNLHNLVSKEQLEEYIRDLRRPQVQEHLSKTFGITLTAEENTITFNTPNHKKHYIIK